MKWACALFFVMACSTEHAVVATLDSAGEGGAHAEAGDAAGGSADPGGTGGTLPLSGDAGASGASGASGANGASGASGDAAAGARASEAGASGAGAISAQFCACSDQSQSFCGSDGQTHTTLCLGPCPTISVSCFHDCPCVPQDTISIVFWFPESCMPETICSNGYVCLPISSDTQTPGNDCPAPQNSL